MVMGCLLGLGVVMGDEWRIAVVMQGNGNHHKYNKIEYNIE